jgi:hypothetical protein
MVRNRWSWYSSGRPITWVSIRSLFDLDDLCAHLGHQSRGRGAGKGVGKIQYLVSCQERPFSHRFSFLGVTRFLHALNLARRWRTMALSPGLAKR